MCLARGALTSSPVLGTELGVRVPAFLPGAIPSLGGYGLSANPSGQNTHEQRWNQCLCCWGHARAPPTGAPAITRTPHRWATCTKARLSLPVPTCLPNQQPGPSIQGGSQCPLPAARCPTSTRRHAFADTRLTIQTPPHPCRRWPLTLCCPSHLPALPGGHPGMFLLSLSTHMSPGRTEDPRKPEESSGGWASWSPSPGPSAASAPPLPADPAPTVPAPPTPRLPPVSAPVTMWPPWLPCGILLQRPAQMPAGHPIGPLVFVHHTKAHGCLQDECPPTTCRCNQ